MSRARRSRRGRRHGKRRLAAAGTAVALAAVTLAVHVATAGNTVPSTSIGDVHQAAPAYQLTSGPTYASSGGIVTGVSFRLNTVAGTAGARVTTVAAPSRPYQTCTSPDGLSWTCPVPPALPDGDTKTFAWFALQ